MSIYDTTLFDLPIQPDSLHHGDVVLVYFSHRREGSYDHVLNFFQLERLLRLQ